MDAGKGKQNRFSALPARDLKPVQVSYLTSHFELAPQSVVAEAVVEKTNQTLKAHEVIFPRFCRHIVKGSLKYNFTL